MYGAVGISANDPVTLISTPKLQGTGRVQGLNSKFTLTYSQVQFTPMTDAEFIDDTFRGNAQLPISS
jgi:hypothetical protein